jgi:2-amino-4-hydroxy-6-hydroxymethyldihydropteridine diphosphokinase
MQRTHPIPAYVALGSNLGDRELNIHRALDLLDLSDGVSVRQVSTFLENPSVGGPDDAPDFLNAAARIDTVLGAHALLHRLLDIERTLGRVRRLRWEPRPIDLDLLLYNDQIISSDELIVPHPLMHERLFVLKPLSEIAPDIVHPTLQMTIAGLLDSLLRPPT